MRRNTSSVGQGPGIWLILGLLVLVILALGLVWVGYMLGQRTSAEPSPTAAESVLPTGGSTAIPTFAPLPTYTPLPTATPFAAEPTAPPSVIPTEPVAAVPMITASDTGVNVRSGPGTNFSVLGRLDPGAQAQVTGKYGEWWQIAFDGESGWVAGWVVTASDAESVAEVVPPASPEPPPATAVPPTNVPPTEAPQPAAAECFGLVADDFQVEGAPGPYPAGGKIWFNIWISNQKASALEYRSLGVDALQDGQKVKYHQSYSYSKIAGYSQFQHRDHIVLNQAGTYQLWLTIGRTEEEWCRLMGPIEVVIQ